MGTARNRKGKMVVLKVVNYEQLSAKDFERLQQEGAIMRNMRIDKCDFIVKFNDSWLKRDLTRIYLEMEFCAGGDVKHIMKALSEKPLTENQIKIVCIDMLFALEYLHAKKWIHRDIKAANILIDQGGHCKLADFGLSYIKGNDSSNRAKSGKIGTGHWMAPGTFHLV